ncbi:MAG: hypothetical protein ACKOXK_11785, partial [Chakrabartia sp.]
YDRPVVPTYATKKSRHYCYYETRKDLARPADPKPVRFQQGALDQHVISGVCDLLNDEHGLRRLAYDADAKQLRRLFEEAQTTKAKLEAKGAAPVLRALVAEIRIQKEHMEISLNPSALGLLEQEAWRIKIPLPTKRPFREARLLIDAESSASRISNDLLELVSDAFVAKRLVLASPGLSLNQIAKREGRCRTQLARLLRLSWVSPRIIEAIADGTQPKGLTRRALLISEMPIDWAEQEMQFGIGAR